MKTKDFIYLTIIVALAIGISVMYIRQENYKNEYYRRYNRVMTAVDQANEQAKIVLQTRDNSSSELSADVVNSSPANEALQVWSASFEENLRKKVRRLSDQDIQQMIKLMMDKTLYCDGHQYKMNFSPISADAAVFCSDAYFARTNQFGDEVCSAWNKVVETELETELPQFTNLQLFQAKMYFINTIVILNDQNYAMVIIQID